MIEFNPEDVVSIYIEEDRETAERCGASGTFQVISVTLTMEDGSVLDVTENVDQGFHYFSQQDVASSLGLDPDKIDYDNCDELF
ncbi:hypothetical protein [uncultured Ruminococcus sp.]|uniref:hypothetical protein n=1 Tax=uncultured Ruminococcus sp. TaxID=165186 RepID=UPI002608E154|nr:hypothetical protein [uncultured Ruminococcus sp.]